MPEHAYRFTIKYVRSLICNNVTQSLVMEIMNTANYRMKHPPLGKP